jgi:hypothetical protein
MYNNNRNRTTTVEDLATAINRVPDYAYLEGKESLKLSHRILNYFGYGGLVADFSLEKDMRGVFYMLEDAGLLSSHVEYMTLYDGKKWNLYYWTLRRLQT